LTDSLRTRPLGAHRVDDHTWSFLVWAPEHESMGLRVDEAGGESRDVPLEQLGRGYYGALVEVDEATSYQFVDSAGRALPDPASRRQPQGVHGPSMTFDPGRFEWTASTFRAPDLSDSVIYEIHIGTFTPEGTFDAAIDRLDDLRELGVTTIEPMPIGAFPGERNWGYDGAFPFAVHEGYGGPEAFQRFVDACHARGLAVMLDVVYNHLGPEGVIHREFGPYFTETYATPWGAAMNFADPGSDEVRRYFSENALMWLRDFRVDGLRLDAVHGIVDPTASPFLTELTAQVATLADSVGRPRQLVAESADNNPLVITDRARNGQGFDGQWNDDFHHALHAVLTGERDGYYQDFGALNLLARAYRDGFAFQGEYSAFRDRRHGAPSAGIPTSRFVVFAQNHDQVGNRAGAERLAAVVDTDRARLGAAVVLLSPFVPLLFMGEEYGESAPFPYFIDHSDPGLVEAVRRGRAAEFGREGDQLDPADAATFDAARLDWSRRDGEGAELLATYRALLATRAAAPIITDPTASTETAVVGDALVVRRANDESRMVAAFNFGGSEVKVDLPHPIGRVAVAPAGYRVWVDNEELT
jgi:maltooligosyltrehalose trehalohydrolase